MEKITEDYRRLQKIAEDDLNKVTGGAYAEVVDGDSDGPITYIYIPPED